jgi:glyoxalase family protein
MGFRQVGQDGAVTRFATGAAGPGGIIDVRVDPELRRGVIAAGNVHHVAWRAADDGVQEAWRRELVARDVSVTHVLDREYFHSIYFREPGGVLFEIATDPPGFTVDEPEATLGTALKLPPWLEAQRDAITLALPPLD